MNKERTAEELKADLMIAWQAWEERPGNAAAVLDMEDLCHEAAAFLHTTPNKFRIHIAQLRRARLPMDKVLNNVFSIRWPE